MLNLPSVHSRLTTARAHHQPLQRSEAHGRFNRPPARHGAHAAARPCDGHGDQVKAGGGCATTACMLKGKVCLQERLQVQPISTTVLQYCRAAHPGGTG